MATIKHSDFGALEPRFGERMPAPSAVETDSDDAWAEFEKLREQGAQAQQDASAAAPQHQHPAFVATVPSHLPSAPAPAPRQPVAAELTANDVMVEARRFNRVCPKPEQWQQLYDLLPGKVATGRIWQPPPPLTGAAWNATSAMPKRMCLREQIEWAERQGALPLVMGFFKSLSEDQWHHMGD